MAGTVAGARALNGDGTRVASKRPRTIGPKMEARAAGVGVGTAKMAKWRLRRLGMSLRPAAGVCMAATKLW